LSENWYEYKKNVGTILEEDIFGKKNWKLLVPANWLYKFNF
jgi:hypothetical protein